MSAKLISRSPDLKRLRDEGYEVEIVDGFLVLHSIPYVNSKCEVVLGALATDLTLNNEQTQRPSDHQVWFSGEFPCKRDGSPISALRHTSSTQNLCKGLQVHHRFSCKPPEGYPDYYSKMTRYVEIISNEAKAADPTGKMTAQTFKPITTLPEDSVFIYSDSASSRAGIASLAEKLAMEKIAIIGLGGTGAYVCDLVAKTHAKEIHLFDSDEFLQHNAYSRPSWTRIPRQTGQSFQRKLDTDSTASWTVAPAQTGQA